VPVEVHYPPVAERVSHYRVGRDTLRIIAYGALACSEPGLRAGGLVRVERFG
jgi:hypothetical protein